MTAKSAEMHSVLVLRMAGVIHVKVIAAVVYFVETTCVALYHLVMVADKKVIQAFTQMFIDIRNGLVNKTVQIFSIQRSLY